MNNQKFETSICPMCSSILQVSRICGVTVARCPSVTAYPEQSHYEVECDAKQCIQHMYLSEWGIDNYIGSARSRVYKRVGKRWQLVTEVPQLKPDTEENLTNRLGKLIQNL